MRALLFDAGNTRLKWGVLDGGVIARTGSITQETLRESGFNALTTRLPRRIDRVLACNVAGATFATRLSGVIGIHCNTDVHFVRSEESGHGLVSGYTNPRQLGVDRWIAMIGARAQLKGALLVVDAGTAVTIDAVDREGRHLGGRIVPGIHLMCDALNTETSDIAKAAAARRRPGAAAGPFAHDTKAAVLGGATSAICGAIAPRPVVVLTGGDASRILPLLDGKPVHRPNLVLEGLAHILESDT
jgi:type III pantothenate kinase